MPASWTHVVLADPFVSISAGRAMFRTDDLFDLVRLVSRPGDFVKRESTSEDRCRSSGKLLPIWHKLRCTCVAFVPGPQRSEDSAADHVTLDLGEPQLDLVQPKGTVLTPGILVFEKFETAASPGLERMNDLERLRRNVA